MKPRARWVNFVSWFVNTSPEWVAPDEREPQPTRERQERAGDAVPGARPMEDASRNDAPTNKGVKPDRSRR
jgi:hypothetical protein